jgi:hypothetical protein
MTVDEFHALNHTQKAEAVWQGVFLGDRKADTLLVQLYALNGFYVEVFYDPAANLINAFEAFTNKQLLAPYLAQLKFPVW